MSSCRATNANVDEVLRKLAASDRHREELQRQADAWGPVVEAARAWRAKKDPGYGMYDPEVLVLMGVVDALPPDAGAKGEVSGG